MNELTPSLDLSPPAPRRQRHTRRIHAEGFEREDGLWDIEARIVDTKTYPYNEPYRGRREPGSRVHDMVVRLTLDPSLVVRGIEVVFPSTPYGDCAHSGPTFDRLIGARVTSGWRKAVMDAVGGAKGCTHVRELLFPMATVAIQTIVGWPEATEGEGGARMPGPRDPNTRPPFIDGCYAWSSSGNVVKDLYPTFYVTPADDASE
ncbi:MAG: DUF2889 domain-containing protein [Burkholderiaceae bacterium]|nr:DUF2889 domain-containing protein [Burkholderiaceae bacterium]